MKGAWRRLGKLDLDTSRASWAATHAALPVVEAIGDGEWNVYLSLRDERGRARIGRTQLTLAPASLAALECDPVLDLGVLGAFDDSGVVTSSVVADGDARYLFYTGWSLGVSVPFYLMAGVAVSRAGGPFERASHAPLLDRHPHDPFLTASPFVRVEDGRWRMWYVSGSDWIRAPSGTPRHRYNIRYAESDQGREWRRDGRVCIDYSNPAEYAFARPWVVRDPDIYRMWFAFRGDRYSIGYAESADGMTWVRDDDAAGLSPSSHGWDSEMVEYPCVFDHGGARYMLYNGNDYGRGGLGLARWEGLL
jgi:hypothetical protein